MATVRWETPADWAEQAFRETKSVHVAFEQEDAMAALADEYAATAGFLDLITVALGHDSDPAMREVPPSATWYVHALPWAGDRGPSFSVPADQHRALMVLHHLTNDLNSLALDFETRLTTRASRQRRDTASRPAQSGSLPTMADTSDEDLKLHGQELAAAVEEMRAAVSFWAKERSELQERVDEAEHELARLEEAADSAAPTGTAADDTSRPAVFRQLRNERVQVQAHADSIRRLLALPL